MNEGHKPDPLDDLEARLGKARRRQDDAAIRRRDTQTGLGFAMRLGVELVAALGVGVGIGLLLDRWLGTTPWLMLLFFILGAVAGFLNVYRTATGQTRRAGRTGTPESETKEDGSPR